MAASVIAIARLIKKNNHMSLLSLFMLDHPFIFSVSTVLRIFGDHRLRSTAIRWDPATRALSLPFPKPADFYIPLFTLKNLKVLFIQAWTELAR